MILGLGVPTGGVHANHPHPSLLHILSPRVEIVNDFRLLIRGYSLLRFKQFLTTEIQELIDPGIPFPCGALLSYPHVDARMGCNYRAASSSRAGTGVCKDAHLPPQT